MARLDTGAWSQRDIEQLRAAPQTLYYLPLHDWQLAPPNTPQEHVDRMVVLRGAAVLRHSAIGHETPGNLADATCRDQRSWLAVVLPGASTEPIRAYALGFRSPLHRTLMALHFVWRLPRYRSLDVAQVPTEGEMLSMFQQFEHEAARRRYVGLVTNLYNSGRREKYSERWPMFRPITEYLDSSAVS